MEVASEVEKVWSVISFEPKKKKIIKSGSPVFDDGYKWRKYDQKDLFGSKFPRKYYKCAYKKCKVSKQVQRLSMDEAVIVTYYRGLHSHSHSHSPHLSSPNLPKQWTNLN